MAKPPKNLSEDNGNSDSESANVNIYGDFYHHPNDISELRKLADSHPDLAKQIVADRRAQHQAEHRTERMGMVLAVVFGVVLISGASWTLVQLGWWQSLMFVACLLGISHVLRTILKGEFSDTSWFGSLISGKVKPPKE